MSKDNADLIVVGAILGAHGVRGDVRVKSFTAEPEALFSYGSLVSESGDVLVHPNRVRTGKDHFIVTPKQLRQKEEWDALKGTRLHVSRQALPLPEDDEFYIEDLVGLEVYSGGDDKIGYVKAVLNHGAGDLLEVQAATLPKPVLIPFTRADVPTIDIGLGRVIVSSFEVWADDSRPVDED